MFQATHLNKPSFTGFTVGTVVDTNDPQQTGRLRICVPAYGDRFEAAVKELPWAMYVTPFGGTVNNDRIKRGTEQSESDGPVGYGFWNIPKLGSTVIVTCIDGNPMTRVWVGCLHTERLGHTLPHGRYMVNSDGEPDGPLDSYESPIQPLYGNQQTAFGSKSGNYEWRTRGADYSAAANTEGFYINDGINNVADDKDVTLDSPDGKSVAIRQGYGLSQIEPHLTSENTGSNYDSQVYSWTTPGFHSISMDDRKENCRVKIRTTAGHQIIMDDTNERIYINTSEGKNWIELDQDGNIDVYATTKVNIRSEGDINFTANKSIRMYADESIHMYTNDIRIQAVKDYHVRVGAKARIHSVGDMLLQTDSNFHTKVSKHGHISTGGTLYLKASGDIIGQCTFVHFNGPPAQPAAAANEDPAKWTNRIPAHEPYMRSTTLNDYTHEPKYPYDDPSAGSEDKTRGSYWRR
jgi:hypothetical protein